MQFVLFTNLLYNGKRLSKKGGKNGEEEGKEKGCKKEGSEKENSKEKEEIEIRKNCKRNRALEKSIALFLFLGPYTFGNFFSASSIFSLGYS